MKFSKPIFAGCLCSLFLATQSPAAVPVKGWLNWRGPDENGVSRETGLPDSIQAKDALWTADFPGQSTAVVANGHVYIMGYLGEGPDLQEGVACFDADTGKKIWQQLHDDYLSDTIYLRYATSSVGIDGETGNVYSQGTQGLISGFTPDGKPLWKIPMMEIYGRMTFPNSRTASPIVDGDLVITRGITANWGANGPAGDRFYAFDKKTGDLVWTASTGARPTDNSFSLPYLMFLDGRRVMIASTGDGNIFCANARTGEALWRIPIAKAGINASLLVHNQDTLIAIYGTPYEPGQLVALKIPHVAPANGAVGPVIIERSQVEVWSNPVSTSTSSPILVGDRIYVVSEKGSLCMIDVANGKTIWQTQIGIEQRNSCPLFADGKIYVPILDDPQTKTETGEAGTKGALYVFRPGEEKPEMLSHTALEGRCFGTPTAYNGKVYMQTTRKFYCFGKRGNNPGLPEPVSPVVWPKAGPATQLQIVPSEVMLEPGQSKKFHVRSLDAKGFVVDSNINSKNIKWASYVPPTARVKSTMNGSFSSDNVLKAAPASVTSAGAFEASVGDLKGYFRGRIMPGLPLKENFDELNLTETTTNTVEQPTPFAYPPLAWIGARFKFDVREKDGTKVLAKTIDNKFFQRATVFLGPPDLSNYTVEADVMSEGNKRKMSEVGVIVQRYLVTLKGNDQKLEISSNFERLRVPAASEPPNFKWSPNVWYHLKARVDTAADGSGTIRAKAWKKGEPEPETWIVEAHHKTAHQNGAPGLFGFAPQAMRVFVDNISVTKNQ